MDNNFVIYESLKENSRADLMMISLSLSLSLSLFLLMDFLHKIKGKII